MATDKPTIERLLAALAPLEPSARAMFGEYGLYVDGRMVASVCDGALFVKATDAGRAVAPPLEEATPYPGAKPALKVEEGSWGEPWLIPLLAETAAALPVPNPRKRR